MTFCGDLPFVPSGIHHHLFENLRRKGHHCHGLTHLSWAERKIFYRVLGKKFGTVAKLAMRQPFVLFKGLTFQKLCLPGAFRPGDHHN
ncbi:hypothetical protein M2A27_27525, partial [Klebsiella pneumoniae]|nr:hypothetical protein [Klebsiella pneumoniae]MDZ3316071.1 hypothetical protein [Klebsiella pneumoniae]